MRPIPAVSTMALFVAGASLPAQAPDAPWLRDRGPGMPTSMFGTYVQKGEWLVYPFAEWYRDRDFEYKPSEMGYGTAADYFGRYRATEALVFVAYGLTDRLALELEGAMITARLDKAANDPSSMPAALEESGVGDIEGQLRMRWNRESATRPEFFSYVEAVSPRNRTKALIGTSAWEFKLGSGIIKSTSLGTFTARLAVDHSVAEHKTELGEAAVEFLRQLSPRWRLYTGVEGSQGEIAWITELQLRLTGNAVLKLNNAMGMSARAVDWAPEVGIMFSFPRRR